MELFFSEWTFLLRLKKINVNFTKTYFLKLGRVRVRKVVNISRLKCLLYDISACLKPYIVATQYGIF